MRQFNKTTKLFIFIVAVFAVPFFALAVNDVSISDNTNLELNTSDTAVLTTIVADAGGQVTNFNVESNFIDITLDNLSSVTFTTTVGGQFLKITKQSGSNDYTVSPSCPTATVTLTGTGLAVVLRLTVQTTNSCSSPSPSPSPSRSASGGYVNLSAAAPVASPVPSSSLFSSIQTETPDLFPAASSGEEQNGSGQVFAGASQLITQGDRGDHVRDIQIFLLSQGLNPGPIDGIFGPKTCSSLKQFQSASGLIADCIVGPKTQKALADYQSEESEYSQEKIKEFQRNLGFGDSGPDVQNLQKFLNQQGFAVASEGPGASGQETSLFGQRTQSALRRFQEFIVEKNPAVVSQVVSSGFLDFFTRAYINRLLGEF